MTPNPSGKNPRRLAITVLTDTALAAALEEVRKRIDGGEATGEDYTNCALLAREKRRRERIAGGDYGVWWE